MLHVAAILLQQKQFLLAALELNLQQQNTVKLAESKQLFCDSEKQSSKQPFRLQRTFFVAECFGFNVGDNA